ncbi:MAG: GWxTD domain-containing protein [Bacteroidota bacterium]
MMKIQHLLLVAFLSLWGTTQAMDLSVTHNTFKGPNYNFVELHLFVLGTSVQYQALEADQLQAGLEILLLIKQDTSIIQYDKYQLSSPISAIEANFMDIKRYALPNGTYQLEVIVKDVNDPANEKTHRSTIVMDYGADALALSDIQLLGAFQEDQSNNPMAKSGFLMENLPFNFYTKKADRLMFYVEIYNSDRFIQDQYLIRYFIERLSGNGKRRPILTGHKKRLPKPVNILLMQKSIAQLPSGNYNLRVELRDQQNKLLIHKNVPFQRSNPRAVDQPVQEQPSLATTTENFTNRLSVDVVRYSLKAITPIIDDASVEVLNMVIGGKDSLAQRRMLFTFWNGMDARDPEGRYLRYMEVARAVDKLFDAGFGHGFESDRGFVYMKYGQPDDIVREENEPSAPPYEIWIYNDFPRTTQANVRFLFYNPTLAPGQFQLLHSTARGELNNPQWEVELYRDDGQSISETDFDSTTVPDNVYRRARRYFTDF